MLCQRFCADTKANFKVFLKYCKHYIYILGNTRVIGQKSLQMFQEEMGKVKKDPYRFVMKQTQLPITLLNETAKVSR